VRDLDNISQQDERCSEDRKFAGFGVGWKIWGFFLHSHQANVQVVQYCILSIVERLCEANKLSTFISAILNSLRLRVVSAQDMLVFCQSLLKLQISNDPAGDAHFKQVNWQSHFRSMPLRLMKCNKEIRHCDNALTRLASLGGKGKLSTFESPLHAKWWYQEYQET